MKCPTCGTKLPPGRIECEKCIGQSRWMLENRPIEPEPTRGSPALGLVVGLAVAGLGAFGWAWLVQATDRFHSWPAVVIGVAVGMTVRFAGGAHSSLKGFIGAFCGLVGIGGAIAVIVFLFGQAEMVMGAAADFGNIVLLFIGLSLSRSLPGTKKGEIPKVLQPGQKRRLPK